MSTLARRLAEYAVAAEFDQLSETVVHEVKRRVLDSFGCAFGAWDSEVAQIVRSVAQAETASPGAGIVGLDHSASPMLAAFANGAMVRYLDFNDTYLSLEPAHPSDNIAPCLAAAEVAGASGRQLITAIALAYEIQCRMCDAASIRARGWDHVTYGCFSSAVGAGKLLGLDAAQMEQAINLAGVNAAALRQTRVGQLSMWKGCAFANAARQGVFAARLAAAGLSGPDEIFEGPMGFFQQVSGPMELAVEGWGAPTMISRTSIKFWPAEYHSQSAIDAALQLRPQVGDPAEIAEVRIHSFDAAVDIIGSEPEKWRPTSRETADHSMPYCVAVALLDGEVSLSQFAPDRIRREDVRRLMDRITITRDPELTARYPAGIPNRLEVIGTGGGTSSLEVTYPRGHDQNPMTDAEVLEKYRSLARLHLSAERVEALAELGWRLEEVNPKDLLRAAKV